MARRKSDQQPALFEYEKPPEEKILYVHPGVPWPCGGVPARRNRQNKGCPFCRAILIEGLRGFREGLHAGKWNRQGYTPREWRAAGYDPAEFKNCPSREKRSRVAVPESE